MERKKLSFFNVQVSAGFPSPAEDFKGQSLDLNTHLVKHPTSSFFVRVTGDSMIGAGIIEGDLLVVDRSLSVKNSDIVLAVLNGEFTVKRWIKKKERVFLVPENPSYNTIEIKQEVDFQVWGVVTSAVHFFR